MIVAASIAFKQRLMPQHRSWGEVADMLASYLHVRPALLLCKRCRGEHFCFDESLTIHCACGTVTRYERYVLFHMWSSLTWSLVASEHHGNCVDGTNPLRWMSLVSAKIVDAPLTRPQQPIDTRVMQWRFRSGNGL